MNYNLDGSKSTSEMGKGTLESVATWQGEKLLLTGTATPTGGEPIKITQTLALEGGMFVIVTTSSAKGGQTNREVYTKVK